MLKKKGNISIYIIIGTIFIISSILFFYITNGTKLNKSTPVNLEKVRLDYETIEGYLRNLIKIQFSDALIVSAEYGGRIYDNNYILSTEKDKISYFTYYGHNTIPKEEILKKNILEYLNKSIRADSGLDIIEQKGFSIEFSDDINGKIIFYNNKTILKLRWTIFIKKISDKSSKRIDTFNIKEDTRYYNLYSLAKDISLSNTNSIIYNNYNERNLSIQLFPYDKYTTIYSITDHTTSPKLVFIFAVNKHLNSKPTLDYIPDFSVILGEHLIYHVSATDPDGDNIEFYTDNDKINIDPINGEINFIPFYAGKFTANIFARDSFGLIDSQKVTFEINPDDPASRIISDDPIEINLPVKTNIDFKLPIYSSYLTNLKCSSSSPLISFNDCNLIMQKDYNIIIGKLNDNINVIDDYGYEKIVNLKIDFFEDYKD